MTRNLSVFCLLLAVATLASAPTYADSKMVNGKHFMSLASARTGQPARLGANKPTSQVQRSDMKAMRSGFLRLDRDLVINAARTPRVVKATEQAPESVALLRANAAPRITRGDAVTDLFGDNGGSEAPVFGKTLRNTNAPSRSGHVWPIPASVNQRISSGYGMRKDPFAGDMRFHGGIDIAAAKGSSVLASAAGTVMDVGKGGRLGDYVTIAHSDGTESSYGHLSAQSVRKGQKVTQGQVIGKVGSSGRSTGPHLDYRIKKNGIRVNPMTVLNAPQGTSTKVAQVIQVR